MLRSGLVSAWFICLPLPESSLLLRLFLLLFDLLYRDRLLRPRLLERLPERPRFAPPSSSSSSPQASVNVTARMAISIMMAKILVNFIISTTYLPSSLDSWLASLEFIFLLALLVEEFAPIEASLYSNQSIPSLVCTSIGSANINYYMIIGWSRGWLSISWCHLN